MRSGGWVAAAGALALAWGGAALSEDKPAEGKPCDVATVKKASWCDCCKVLLEKDQIDEEGKCKKCKSEPKTVDVCVKNIYKCPCCPAQSLEPGTCEKCKKDLECKAVKSRVVWRCDVCKAVSAEPGKCSKPCCKDTCPELKKSCEMSGLCPHVGK